MNIILKTTINTIIVVLLVWLTAYLQGCQLDNQWNTSARFLMENESYQSREVWAFGNRRP